MLSLANLPERRQGSYDILRDMGYTSPEELRSAVGETDLINLLFKERYKFKAWKHQKEREERERQEALNIKDDISAGSIGLMNLRDLIRIDNTHFGDGSSVMIDCTKRDYMNKNMKIGKNVQL